MTRKILSLLFAFTLSVIFSLVLVNATQSFDVNPTSFADSVVIGSTESGSIQVTNTGTENINLSISKTNLASGSNSITLNLAQTSFNNINPGNSVDIDFTYSTSGNLPGSYSGSVIVTNPNTSQVITVPVSIELSAQQGASIVMRNFEETGRFEMRGDIGQRVTRNVRFLNDGNISLTGVRISVTDLQGDLDDINRNDVRFDRTNFNLDVGRSQTIEIRVDIPRGISEGIYEGTLSLQTNQGNLFEYTLEVSATADNLDISIRDNNRGVRNGMLEIVAEAGRSEEADFLLENNGNVNMNNIRIELDSDLQEEFSSNTMPRSAITFFPSNLDLFNRDNEIIDVRVQVPSGQATGNYYADIRVVSDAGRVLDEIGLKVRVIGDVYVRDVVYDREVSPNSNLNVEVIVRNQKSRLQRDIRVTGTILNIDNRNSDLTETSSSFILGAREERSQNLRFSIPREATDGSKILELVIEYDGGRITELYQLDVVRPVSQISIETFTVNPMIVTCDTRVYTNLRVRNLGRNTEDVSIVAEVRNTPILSQTGTFSMNPDDTAQRNLMLDVSGLEPGSYDVLVRAVFAGISVREELTINVRECRDGTGIIIEPIEPEEPTEPVVDDSKVVLFGQEFERMTVYLGTGIAIVFVLVLLSLFLL